MKKLHNGFSLLTFQLKWMSISIEQKVQWLKQQEKTTDYLDLIICFDWQIPHIKETVPVTGLLRQMWDFTSVCDSQGSCQVNRLSTEIKSWLAVGIHKNIEKMHLFHNKISHFNVFAECRYYLLLNLEKVKAK